MVIANQIESQLYQTLDENEVFATIVQIQRGLYNREVYGNPPAVTAYYEGGAQAPLTAYEGDVVSIWMGVWNTQTQQISGFGLGADEDGWMKVRGLAGNDIEKAGLASYSWHAEVSQTGGRVDATFDRSGTFNDTGRQGLRIETGAPAEYVPEVGLISGNGSASQSLQTIRFEGWLDNPWYQWSTEPGADLLSGLNFAIEVNYVDYADGLLTGKGRETSGSGRNDKLKGKGGVDLMEGKGGKDLLLGKGGSDRLEGGGGNDRLKGGAGADMLDGGPGRDKLWGGSGADWLIGGAGKDRLSGGGGADVFEFGRKDGKDVVLDWSGKDSLAISGGAATFEDLTLRVSGEDLAIAWAQTKVVLKDVGPEAFDDGDVVFL
ncbi:calcium-binding protein [uncultured Albimonas sp.]|uniref:calcium-binding protein n=1 Tax=uncultured Albimonas sp. TaxID=1331701 RepID=UPI0030EF737F